MTDVKEDHRIRVTKAIIKDAFVSLLQKRPIKDISVKELCAEANINRSTFYFHYTDVYDLLEQIEQEMFDDLRKMLDTSNYDLVYLANSIYKELFMFIEKHLDMCEVLIVKNTDPTFLQKVSEIGHEKYIQICMFTNPNADKTKLEYFYVSLLAGYIAIIGKWLEGGRKESINEIAEIARQLTTEGISALS